MSFTQSKCIDCNKTIGYVASCVNGRCGNCYAQYAIPRCIVCGKQSQHLDGNNVCATFECGDRFEQINRRAAEVALRNAA